MLRKPSYRNPRDGDEYKRFRKAVLRRDGYKCQMPGCSVKSKLEIHHIVRWADSFHGRLNTSNAISLCRHHHKDVVTGNEHHYKSLFLGIVQRKENEN